MRHGQIVNEIDLVPPYGKSIAGYITEQCYVDDDRPSLAARDAISADWDNKIKEVARIDEADQAGTLASYLAAKERTP